MPVQQETSAMNNDRIEGNWKQLKGKLKEQWGKLTDDDLDVIAGKREQLLGRIQERHGIARNEAEEGAGKPLRKAQPDLRLRKIAVRLQRAASQSGCAPCTTPSRPSG
jgi:uncharacterized protein YjbJ (UPF0337 family)